MQFMLLIKTSLTGLRSKGIKARDSLNKLTIFQILVTNKVTVLATILQTRVRLIQVLKELQAWILKCLVKLKKLNCQLRD